MIIANHHKPGSWKYDGYEPSCAWPDDCYVQWGSVGVVLREAEYGGSYWTAFFESFPTDPKTFIRGEGETVQVAEAKAYQAFQRYRACNGHEFERRNYTNGAGFCKHCGLFKSQAFEPLPDAPNRKPGMLEKLLLSLGEEEEVPDASE